jgi:hypothetical protein
VWWLQTRLPVYRNGCQSIKVHSCKHRFGIDGCLAMLTIHVYIGPNLSKRREGGRYFTRCSIGTTW